MTLDPIGDFERRVDDFLLYLDTAFRAKPWIVNEERRSLLMSSDDCFQIPYIEPLPTYIGSGVTTEGGFSSCVTSAGVLIPLFDEAMRQGLFSTLSTTIELYQHQTDMLHRVIDYDEHGVITSGTGSGKTEAFMMPVLYHILKELNKAGMSGPAPTRHPRCYDWWMEKQYYTSPNVPKSTENVQAHREALHSIGKSAQVSNHASNTPQKERKQGMRALILYPMNALVEDQMRRLRLALDSKEMHKLYDIHCNGHRPRFARYSRATIGGTRNPFDGSQPGTNKKKQKKAQTQDESLGNKIHRDIFEPYTDMFMAINGRPPSVGEQLSNLLPQAPDVGFSAADGFSVASPWGCEARTRWDMHDHVPDIIVTNNSMLSIMLMREFDDCIFDRTTEYLDHDPVNAKFHLVIDELHLMRDASGTSTALLIRMLLERLDMLPGGTRHHQLKILASSASLEDVAATEYLQAAFGVEVTIKRRIDPQETLGNYPRPFFLTAGNIEPLQRPTGIVNIDKNKLPTPHQTPIQEGDLEQLNPSPFIKLADLDPIPNLDPDALTPNQTTAIDEIIESLQGPLEGENRFFRLAQSLVNAELNALLMGSFQEAKNGGGYRLRARSIFDISKYIFGLSPPVKGTHIFASDSWRAVKGLLRARALIEGDFVRLRLHTMTRNIPGMFSLAERQTAKGGLNPERSVGEITFSNGPPRPASNNHPGLYKPIECLYCEICGELFYCGHRGIVREQSPGETWEYTLMDADLDPCRPREQAMAKRVEERSYREMAIFHPTINPVKQVTVWPQNGKTPISGTGYLRTFDTSDDYRARTQWLPARLDPCNGDILVINPKIESPTRFSVRGRALIAVGIDRFEQDTILSTPWLVDEKNDDHIKALSNLRGLPETCPACLTSFQNRNQRAMSDGRRPRKSSPIRGFRTGFEEVTQILLRALYEQLPPDNSKIMAFSDSRDRAERLNKNVNERHHSRLIGEIAMQRIIEIGELEPILVQEIISSGTWAKAEVALKAAGREDVLSMIRRLDKKPSSDSSGDGHVYEQRQLGKEWEMNHSVHGVDVIRRNDPIETEYYRTVPLHLLLDCRVQPSSTLTTQPVTGPDDTIPEIALDLLLRGENPLGIGDRAEFPSTNLDWRDAGNPTFKLFTSPRPQFNNSPPLSRRDLLTPFLSGALAEAIFSGRSTLEGTCLGWLRLNDEIIKNNVTNPIFDDLIGMAKSADITGQDAVDTIRQLAEGLLRILLLRNRYRTEWREPSIWNLITGHPLSLLDGRKYIRSFVKKQFSTLSENERKSHEEKILDVLFRRDIGTLSMPGGSVLRGLAQAMDQNGIIQINRLVVRVAEANDRFMLCPSCGTPHAQDNSYLVGICVRCCAELDSYQTISALEFWPRDELSQRLRLSVRPTTRLITDVLTGNTTDPARTQRRFKEILVEGKDDPRLDAIDVLSVTTTTEVGVDMGSLCTIYQSNMPPQRFNYQQRVGRAGRRGQAFSLVQTMCRDTTHDGYYYRNPQRITGDLCPNPRLAVDNIRILKRMFTRICLREAFRTAPIPPNATWNDKSRHPQTKWPDVHGEFGFCANAPPEDPNQIGFLDISAHPSKPYASLTPQANHVKNWLLNDAMVETFAKALLQPYIGSTHPNQNTISLQAELISYARSGEIFQNIVNVVVEKLKWNDKVRMGADDSAQLAYTLAEEGILPVDDMPTSARPLYYSAPVGHAAAPGGREMREIQRDIEQAITMFAPGTKTIIGKRVVEAVGLTSNLEIDHLNLLKNNPSNNIWDDFAFDWCKDMEIDLETDALVSIGGKQGSFKGVSSPFRFTGIRPSGFRAILHTDTSDRWDDRGEFNGGTRMYFDSNKKGSNIPGRNLVFLAETEDVYLINDREERFYDFEQIDEIDTPSYPGPQNFHKAFNQLIEPRYRGVFLEAGTGSRLGSPIIAPIGPNGQDLSQNVALVAPKVTDVLWIHPEKPHPDLMLDPWQDRRKRPGVRAAYRSAAYILRAIISDEHDIDPQELEISLLAPVRVPELVARIVISDKIVNGAGFTVALGNRIEDILDNLFTLSKNDRMSWIKDLLSPTHFRDCSTSCTSCIRYYTNMGEHGLMDWRLGITLLHSLHDPDYNAFANSKDIVADLKSLSPDHDMSGWLDEAERQRDSMQILEPKKMVSDTLNGLPVVFDNHWKVCHVFVHPLWRLDGADGSPGTVITGADADFWASPHIANWGNDAKINWVDTFNGNRRINWCRVNLLG